MLQTIKAWASRLKRQIVIIAMAAKDPRTPWYAKLLAWIIVGYALSPIDLIPDFIPILGYLDDLFLIPIGVVLVLRLIPRQVLEDAEVKAASLEGRLEKNWRAGLFILGLWVGLVILLIHRLMNGN